MKNLIFIKFGGSIITDKTKPYTARIDFIRRLAREVHNARTKRKIKLVIGHGGGSFPHVSATKYKTHKGLINKKSYRGIAVVQNDAAKLNRIVVDALLAAGENAISIQPSSAVITKNGRIVKWDIDCMKKMLDYDLVLVPYGDVGIDIKKGCCIISTEEILNFLSKKLRPEKVVVVGNVDGVYDDKGKVIPEVNASNYGKIKKYLSGSKGIADVTGGMSHKIVEMLELAEDGIKSEIINGEKPGLLEQSILGRKVKGTKIN